MRKKFDRIDPNHVPRNMYPSKADKIKAQKIHWRRPEKAQQVDNGMISHLTKHFLVWETDPSRWDLFGVDTPKKTKNGKSNEDDFW